MDGTFEGETFPHSYARWRTGFLAGPWHAELLHTRASHSRMWDLPGRNETGLGHKAQSAKADISAGAPDSGRRSGGEIKAEMYCRGPPFREVR
jgi:hypothetical protein